MYKHHSGKEETTHFPKSRAAPNKAVWYLCIKYSSPIKVKMVQRKEEHRHDRVVDFF